MEEKKVTTTKKTSTPKEAVKKPAAPKATTKKVVEKKEATSKPVVKKETEKKTVTPKEAEKKPAAKKETTKEVEVKKEKTEVVKKEVKKASAPLSVKNRLKVKYEQEIIAKMMEKYNYSSVMQVPKLHKIVVNVGVGDALTNAKLLEDSVREVREITGQQPVITKAKKSIANFKLREGQSIGCKVTLRGMKMYDFLDKVIAIALPRVRDFRGVSRNAFDGHGNYSLGVKEQLIFPEIDYDKVSKIRGLDIVIVTTAKSDDEAFTLLSGFGMPFRK